MAAPGAVYSHKHSPSPTPHDAHFIDTHLETKESRPFRLDRHHSLRSLDWRQHLYEQLLVEQLWNTPDPVNNMKGTRGEVWHEARVKQTLAVRPVWLRTCHCPSCISSRFLKKHKEKRAEIARAIKRIERGGGCHLYQANPCDCWDHLCTGCSWEAPVTDEGGNEGGDSHGQGLMPLEANILDLVKPPRRSWRRARTVPGLISGKVMPHAKGSAVHSEAKSEDWVFVHEDMLTEGSSVGWDHCSVASL